MFGSGQDQRPAGLVAAVAIVVGGPQLAVGVEGEFLWIAEATGEQFEAGAVGFAPEDHAGVRIGPEGGIGLSDDGVREDGGAAVGDCDTGYSCAYARSIAWAGPTTPLPKQTNPAAVFDRLFAGYDPDASAAEMFPGLSQVRTMSAGATDGAFLTPVGIPTYGISTIRGQSIHNAFFWAINRSQDATFLYDWFSRTGTGAGSEYRYNMGGGNDGTCPVAEQDRQAVGALDGAVDYFWQDTGSAEASRA